MKIRMLTLCLCFLFGFSAFGESVNELEATVFMPYEISSGCDAINVSVRVFGGVAPYRIYWEDASPSETIISHSSGESSTLWTVPTDELGVHSGSLLVIEDAEGFTLGESYLIEIVDSYCDPVIRSVEFDYPNLDYLAFPEGCSISGFIEIDHDITPGSSDVYYNVLVRNQDLEVLAFESFGAPWQDSQTGEYIFIIDQFNEDIEFTEKVQVDIVVTEPLFETTTTWSSEAGIYLATSELILEEELECEEIYDANLAAIIQPVGESSSYTENFTMSYNFEVSGGVSPTFSFGKKLKKIIKSIGFDWSIGGGQSSGQEILYGFNWAGCPDCRKVTQAQANASECLEYMPDANAYAPRIQELSIRRVDEIKFMDCDGFIQTERSNVFYTAMKSGYHCLELTSFPDVAGCPGFAPEISNGFVSNSGASDGFIEIKVDSDKTNLTFDWKGPNGFEATTFGQAAFEPEKKVTYLDGLSEGNYTITVDEGDCCAEEIVVDIEVGAFCNISGNPTYDRPCSFDQTGSIYLNPTGGSGNYTINWSTGSTDQSLLNITSGLYAYTISDTQIECEFDGLASLSVFSGEFNLDANISPSCDGNPTGSIALTMLEGTAPYSFQWSTGAETSTVNGLIEGSYNVTIQDANGCYAEHSFNIPNVENTMFLQTDHEAQSISLFIFAEVESISWTGPGINSGNQHDFVLENLSFGEYCVTVETTDGCTLQDCASLNSLLEVEEENVECFDVENSTILFCLNSTGGNSTTGYSYEWSGDLVDAQGNCAMITVGSDYCVTVFDNDPFSPQTWTDCGNIPLLQAEVVSIQPACPGVSNGQICMQASGGAEVFMYQWTENTESQEDPCSPSNLAGGQTYTVTVTDGCGSEFLVDQYLHESEDCLVVSITNISPSCPDEANGTACVIVEGGTEPYGFEWTIDSEIVSYNTCIWNSLPPNQEVMVTVTDVNGLYGSASITMPDYEYPKVTNPNILQACENSFNGSISFVPVDGIPPYSFQWFGEINLTTEEPELNNISAGVYCVHIVDQCGPNYLPYCFIVEEYENDNPLDLSWEITHDCVNPSGDWGGIDLTVEGNDGSPLTYEWNNGANSQDLYEISEGVYEVIVTQSSGCETRASIEVEEFNPVIVSDWFRSACEGRSDGNISARVKEDDEYVSVDTYNWSHDPSLNHYHADELPAGNYSVTVVTEDGCEASRSWTIEEIPLVGNISANIEGVWEDFWYDGTYNEAQLGSIDLTISEEDNPNYSYQYQWSNGATSQDISELEVGLYTVTITNNYRCPEIRSYYVYSLTEHCAIEVGMTASDPCNSDLFEKNRLTATPNNNDGVSGPYHYRWTRNGYEHHEGIGYESTLTDGSNAEYCVTVTDELGCAGSLCMRHDRRNDHETVRVHPSTDLLDDLWENHTQDFNLVYGSCAGQTYCGDFAHDPWWFPGNEGEGTLVFYPYAGTIGSPCTGGGVIFCTLDDTFIAEVPPIPSAIENTDGDECGCLFPAGSIIDLSNLPVYASMCPEDYSVSCSSNCYCPTGFTCDDNECVAYPQGLECDTDDGDCQCPDDLICVDGLCVVDTGDGTPQCSPDAPCSTGKFCKQGQCIDCPDITVDYCWGLGNTCGDGGDCQIEIDVWSSISGVALIEIIESGQVLQSTSHGVGPNFPQSFTQNVAKCPYISHYSVRVTYSICPPVTKYYVNDSDVYCNNGNCFTGGENIDTRYNEINSESTIQLSDDPQFFVYPNPFMSGITVKGLNPGKDISADVVLLNGLGQEVMRQATLFENGETEIYFENLSPLSSGLYIMMIRSEKEIYETKRLIKVNQ